MAKIRYLDAGLEIQVKLRSLQPLVPAKLRPLPNGALVTLHEPQAGVSPGQACVFYDGERVLGGGWIVRRDRSAFGGLNPNPLISPALTGREEHL